LEKAITSIEKVFGKLDTFFLKSRLDTPAPTDFHPELDDTPFLNEDSVTLYQSFIGILQWAVELGRIDLVHFASTMAKFAALPSVGHMTAVVRGFGHIKKHLKSRIVVDTRVKDWSTRHWTSKDWSKFYPDVSMEIIPPDAPEAFGEPVQINIFCDASHATDLVTRRSTTGIIFFINGTPINWYSRRPNTIKRLTFGSEFIALKIAAEMNDAL
jgi:hypothetical protein